MDPAVALIRTTLNTASKAAPGLAGRAAFEIYRHPFRRSRVRPGEREVHDRAVTGTLRHGACGWSSTAGATAPGPSC